MLGEVSESLGVPRKEDYVGNLFTIMIADDATPGTYEGVFSIDRQLAGGLQSTSTQTVTVPLQKV